VDLRKEFQSLAVYAAKFGGRQGLQLAPEGGVDAEEETLPFSHACPKLVIEGPRVNVIDRRLRSPV
jgi:hypothetical protein